jgi:ribonucleoside-diphosphate reductase alpha chain
MEGIFDAIKDTALIHKSGGGTGFAFSRLRPEGDRVSATGGVASGPVSFMKVFDAATEAIKQGGTRRGANMAILDVHHPDIETFINVKSDMTTLTNFNISVGVDESFMRAVEADEEYDLVNPRTRKVVGRRRAKAVFEQIVANAWRNGDPGLVFLDRINDDNPTPQLGAMEATNPCGEQPLLPYESCNLGSLNLSRFIKTPDAGGRKPEVDWDALAAVIPVAVRFLDDVIDMNAYPVREIDAQTKLTRKIGLGVMGFADLLFELGIPYDSEEALALADRLMAFIGEHADAASEALAAERGVFPAWEDSAYGPKGENRRLRNSTRTTVAQTGTLSIIADCTGGIEPAFSLAFTRAHYLDPHKPSEPVRMIEVNRVFEAAARARGVYSDELVEYLASGGSLHDRPEIPDDLKHVFVTAHDIAPTWHVRMQAAFQRHTDNAVSKTINFPRQATIEDVANAYLLAYREGCKGITIYRDGSRAGQVLSHIAEGEGIPIGGEAAGQYDAPSTQTSELALQPPAPTGRSRRRMAAGSRSRSRYAPPRPALPFAEVHTTDGCPDCGAHLVFSEGCLTCRSCGFTRCG